MNLAEIVTEDGVKLVEGGDYYTVTLIITLGKFRIVKCNPKSIVENGVLTDIPEGNRAANYPIVDGVAKGLWSSRATLEAGLGRGA